MFILGHPVYQSHHMLGSNINSQKALQHTPRRQPTVYCAAVLNLLYLFIYFMLLIRKSYTKYKIDR